MTRVSVVTGAAGAMGSACADALAAEGDALVLTDRDEEPLAELAARLEADGAQVATVIGDVTDPALLGELVQQTAALGALGGLVHTAGLSPSMADWEEVLRVDLAGVVALLDAFGPLAGAGSVAVCLASVSAHMGDFDPAMDEVLDDPLGPDLPGRLRAVFGGEPDPGSTYRLAKRAVVRACRRAAVDWGHTGGRVVSVSPGLIDTGMGRLELAENPIKEHLAAMTPVRSSRNDADTVLPGHTSDIAEVVVFLCSDRARFVSGCDLLVDGGLLAALDHPAPVASAEP